MKKLLLLVAGLLCVGLAQAGCEKGNCGDRTRDCGPRACGRAGGPDCKYVTEVEKEQVMIECPRTETVTVYEKVPAERSRVKTKCLPRETISEWTTPECPRCHAPCGPRGGRCPNNKCGLNRRAAPAEIVEIEGEPVESAKKHTTDVKAKRAKDIKKADKKKSRKNNGY